MQNFFGEIYGVICKSVLFLQNFDDWVSCIAGQKFAFIIWIWYFVSLHFQYIFFFLYDFWRICIHLLFRGLNFLFNAYNLEIICVFLYTYQFCLLTNIFAIPFHFSFTIVYPYILWTEGKIPTKELGLEISKFIILKKNLPCYIHTCTNISKSWFSLFLWLMIMFWNFKIYYSVNLLFTFRQFQMIMMLMESNPQLAPALGRGFAAFSQEIERLEKSKELEVL